VVVVGAVVVVVELVVVVVELVVVVVELVVVVGAVVVVELVVVVEATSQWLTVRFEFSEPPSFVLADSNLSPALVSKVK
jgi:hypothetical protein